MKKLTRLSLPDFAFVEGSDHKQPNELEGRTVILHIRSCSVLEVFAREDVFIDEGVLSYKFVYTNRFGVQEKMAIALHACPLLDKDADMQLVVDEIMRPAAKWYCEYCLWEDENILNEGQ